MPDVCNSPQKEVLAKASRSFERMVPILLEKDAARVPEEKAVWVAERATAFPEEKAVWVTERATALLEDKSARAVSEN